MTGHHLAQLNIGRLHHRIDATESAGFADALDPVNDLAEASPGFVWRLRDDSGNATSIPFRDGDPLWILNLTVWESIEALRDFTYRTDHTEFVRRRTEWFEIHDTPHFVMWWIPAGTVPTVAEASDRLDLLTERGPTADAFTFRRTFDEPR